VAASGTVLWLIRVYSAGLVYPAYLGFRHDVGNDGSLAGSIMTFASPVGLFVVVATILYFLYTRPHTVPGHRDLVPAGGRHTAGARRHAAAQPPPAPPGAGGTPDGGGYDRHDGMEGMQ
jgi:hypothetical protein